ncbi:MAG TPA: hypothetical protein VKA60_04230 [Blastocatellia bacterium]|nr:hypothetical protein [Blastocatellia bacterium]
MALSIGVPEQPGSIHSQTFNRQDAKIAKKGSMFSLRPWRLGGLSSDGYSRMNRPCPYKLIPSTHPYPTTKREAKYRSSLIKWYTVMWMLNDPKELMRKRTIAVSLPQTPAPKQGWLHLEDIATVELTSEDAAHPIEGALLPAAASGWRAAGPGQQTLRLVFDQPQRLRRIHLHFEEAASARTQEFVLRWSDDDGRSFREVVRQQWNFSPPATTEEVEDYHVELAGVTVLELTITPDISGGEARASLRQMSIA